MRILHCCLAAFYIDGYSYQENILPREHKRSGHEVRILASTETFINNKALGYVEGKSYFTEDGIPITRLSYSNRLPHFMARKFRMYKGINEVLNDFKPDIIFLHDLQFLDIAYFARYAKNNTKTKIYVDCHADFSNSARSWLSRNILHKIIYRYCARQIEPFTSVFWGVLPARVDFLINMYGLPKEKVELLLMGAEDKKVEEARNETIRRLVRERFKVRADDFLLMTGGKIDSAKKQTLQLMRAVQKIKDDRVKLIIFGSVSDGLINEFNSLCDDSKIRYIGWVDSDSSYQLFAAADLVVFPGRHSVYWEQVAGLGIPMIVKYWKGTTHVDLGGNVAYLYEDSVDEIKEKISEIFLDKKIYTRMQYIAQTKGMDTFSYRKIAAKSIRAAN